MERRLFGRYELIERIDVGGMAEVFRAVQRGIAGFERVVAIKLILPAIAADPEIIQMFVEEAKLAVQLSHPSIAQIFDLGREGEDYFIAMELVDGESLLKLSERWGARAARAARAAPGTAERSARAGAVPPRLPLGAICHVLIRVASALDYAHSARDASDRPLGIIHRDVSPQNVLVSFQGEVKVIDFGLAKAENRVSQTRDGVVKGKLAYLSPEQARGLSIDRRSDVFSLGVCAWELLTARRAFKRDDDRETVLAIRRGVLEPPSRYAPIPEELDQIVVRALAADPDQRYATALDLRDELDSFVREAGIAFGPSELSALMRTAFPERYEREVAILNEQTSAVDAHALEDALIATDPVIVGPNDGDTVPGMILPDDHERA